MRWSPEELAEMSAIDQAAVRQAVRHGKGYRFWLSTIESDRWTEDDTENLSNRLDGLLQVFGTDPALWRQTYVGSYSENYGARPPYEAVQVAAENRLGEFVTAAAYSGLDIENEEDGTSSPSWFFWLGNDHLLEVECEGEHWTSRYYKHPETGQTFCPSDEDLAELEQQYDIELKYVETEVGFRNDFYAVVQRGPKISPTM